MTTLYKDKPMNLYTIYDKKAQEILPGIVVNRHHAAAIRSFTDLVNQKDNIISTHPEDFDLLHVGEIDPETARVTALDKPYALFHGQDFLTRPDTKIGEPPELELRNGHVQRKQGN